MRGRARESSRRWAHVWCRRGSCPGGPSGPSRCYRYITGRILICQFAPVNRLTAVPRTRTRSDDGADRPLEVGDVLLGEDPGLIGLPADDGLEQRTVLGDMLGDVRELVDEQVPDA